MNNHSDAMRRALPLMDLRELIRGTPFPSPGDARAPDDLIDYERECDRWLDKTREWRAALVALGLPDEWAPKIEQIRYEQRAR